MRGRGGFGASIRLLCSVSRFSRFFADGRADLARLFFVSPETPLASEAFACWGDCEDRSLPPPATVESDLVLPAVESDFVLPAVEFDFVLPAA